MSPQTPEQIAADAYPHGTTDMYIVEECRTRIAAAIRADRAQRSEIQPSAAQQVDAARMLAAIDGVTQFFSDHGVIEDIADKLTCGEVETVSESLIALGLTDASAAWLDFHSLSDDEGDTHHERSATVRAMIHDTGYVVLSERSAA